MGQAEAGGMRFLMISLSQRIVPPPVSSKLIISSTLMFFFEIVFVAHLMNLLLCVLYYLCTLTMRALCIDLP